MKNRSIVFWNLCVLAIGVSVCWSQLKGHREEAPEEDCPRVQNPPEKNRETFPEILIADFQDFETGETFRIIPAIREDLPYFQIGGSGSLSVAHPFSSLPLRLFDSVTRKGEQLVIEGEDGGVIPQESVVLGETWKDVQAFDEPLEGIVAFPDSSLYTVIPLLASVDNEGGPFYFDLFGFQDFLFESGVEKEELWEIFDQIMEAVNVTEKKCWNPISLFKGEGVLIQETETSMGTVKFPVPIPVL
ncbi:MAG TPA: hypothetical protein VJB99_03740 [Patescibacteria group bacterium]|nr:hypothetical protein [Patescibacteria group bacterium]